jgi:hypothetical protein
MIPLNGKGKEVLNLSKGLMCCLEGTTSLSIVGVACGLDDKHLGMICGKTPWLCGALSDALLARISPTFPRGKATVMP